MSRPVAPDLADRIAGLSPEKRELLEGKLRARDAQALRADAIPRRRQRETAPLSFAQQRLYFLDRLEPGSSAYNVPRAIRIRGPLVVPALQKAFEELIRRHEALRSRFVEVSGEVVAEIEPPDSAFRIDVEKIGAAAPDERERKALGIAHEEAERPFDLESGPILRVRLLELDPEHHILLFTLHHIASDAWSAGVLFGELTALYEAFSSGRPSPLTELPLQYGDFAEWQRQWLQGEALQEQLQYWRERLAGAPAALEISTDSPRPPLQSFQGDLAVRRLSPELSAALRELSRRERVTLFMTLLAAFQALLSRYTGQTDILVGTPILHRSRPELEGMIGLFLNTVVLRTDLSGDPTFRALLARVREVAVGAYAHQDLPFEKIVEELHPNRDLGRHPIFQTMVALRNTPNGGARMAGLELEPLEIERKTSKFDFSLFFNDHPEGLVCAVEYATDLFDRETIERLLDHLRVLLESVTRDPDQRVRTVPILTELERKQLLVDWNRTAAGYPAESCLHEVFEAQVERTPDGVALIEGGRSVRYRDLNSEANRLARLLRRRGVDRGSVVAVSMERSARASMALLAVLKAGAAYVPLDPSYPEERLVFMLSDSGARILLTENSSTPRLEGNPADRISLDQIGAELALEPESNLGRIAGPEDLAYVIYTSGSTGVPKGVESLHRASLNRFAWMWRAYPFAPGEICCQKTTLSFVDSIWEVFGPLLQGVPSVLLPQDVVRDPQALIDRLAEERVSRIVLVPSLLRAILDSGEGLATKLATLKWWVSSGEALPIELERRFEAQLPHGILINLYGSSEVSADVTCWDSREAAPRYSVPIGRPIANSRIYLLDEAAQLVPIGVAGEIYVGGDGLARGYRNRPEMTAERFLPDPFSGTPGGRLFKTGDLARYLSDGQLEYLGREDQQVKLRGYRIELGEVESALRNHPGVETAVASVRQGPTGDPGLVAYVVATGTDAPTSEALRTHLEKRLPVFMVPGTFVFLEALPLTPSGKVDRKALPAPESSRPNLDNSFVPPVTPSEHELARIWGDILGLDRVGVDDNFFTLGGHSLLVIQVSSRLRDALGIELPLRSFFETPTIRALASEIDRLMGSKAEPAPPIRHLDGGDLPLSFAQQRLWSIEQLAPGNNAYLIRRAYRLAGALRSATLRQAFDEVVARHDSLRTSFLSSDDGPRQHVAANARAPFSEIDLSGFGPEEAAREAERLAASEGEIAFDLSQGPLLRVRLLRLAPEEHLLLVTMHHAISDAWSIGVLFREVATLYEAFVSGRASPLPPLPVQYGDYAVSQREWMRGDVLERQLSHWRRELIDAPEVLNLRADRPRPATRTHEGERRSLSYSHELAEALKRVGRSQGATLYMTLVAAYACLLSRYTAAEDVLIGSPIAGRNRVETEGLIGLFVSTLVLRARLAGDPTFLELLGRIREAALGAYGHQDLPFEKLVDELRPARSSSYNPIFQVWFVLQNAPAVSWKLPGIRAAAVPPSKIAVRHDLQLTMWETGEGLRGSFDFSGDLFDPVTMDRIAEELGDVLRNVAENPALRLSDLGRILDEAAARRTAADQERLEQASVRLLKNARRKAFRE